MFKLIIAGTRTFNDYQLLRDYTDKLLVNIKEPIEIVSGHARGADALGERYAMEKGYALKIFPAEWDVYGKLAGFRRNVQMAEYADALLAFHDGESSGTKHMIETMRSTKPKAPIRIMKYQNGGEGG